MNKRNFVWVVYHLYNVIHAYMGDVRLCLKKKKLCTMWNGKSKVVGWKNLLYFVGRIILNIIVQVGIFFNENDKNKQSKSRFSVLIVNNGLCTQCVYCA